MKELKEHCNLCTTAEDTNNVLSNAEVSVIKANGKTIIMPKRPNLRKRKAKSDSNDEMETSKKKPDINSTGNCELKSKPLFTKSRRATVCKYFMSGGCKREQKTCPFLHELRAKISSDYTSTSRRISSEYDDGGHDYHYNDEAYNDDYFEDELDGSYEDDDQLIINFANKKNTSEMDLSSRFEHEGARNTKKKKNGICYYHFNGKNGCKFRAEECSYSHELN